MTFPGHNPHLFSWKGCTPSAETVSLRVEMASAFAVSEVFSHKKIKSAINSHAVALQSTDQLQDHDEAYSEAQAILSDWMNKKLRLEMEMEPDQDDDLISSAERSSPVVLATLYNHLAEEQEDSMINSFLQDLMEHDVLDSGAAQRLASDAEQNRKKMRDPSISMEARHQQVRENRARRDAERLEQQREKEAQRAARVEAKRREREEEMRRRHEARKQEEMLQQEMVRLRRQMEEKKSLEQMVRQREREKLERQSAARSLQSGPPPPKKQQHQDEERLYKEQQIQTLCLQRHFSGWYSLLLERRMRMGKVAALSDWKRQLRAWRAWRALVWAQQKQREEERTEEELRAENRRCQQATENNRRRLLRRCLNDWRLWCRMEREQREILARQEETRHKMAALINAASAGKLNTAKSFILLPSVIPLPCPFSSPVAPPAHQENLPVGAVTQPTQPWQVSRRHAALTAGELRRARRRGEAGGGASSTCSQRAASLGSHFEHRHAVQQQTITQQRKLLREQKEQIAQLQEEQTIMRVKLDVQRTRNTSAHLSPSVPKAMEERAHQRAERRREVEELKRKKEEEKLAQMKAAEEERKREEEEEKHRAAERRKEEKRQEREVRNTSYFMRAQAHIETQRHESEYRKHSSSVSLTVTYSKTCPRLKITFSSLSECRLSQLKDWQMIQEERANRFHRQHTLRRVLLALLDHVMQERLAEWDRQELAQQYSDRRVLRGCFRAWRQFPCLQRKEREREMRREQLRRKVAEVLPDFRSSPLQWKAGGGRSEYRDHLSPRGPSSIPLV
uniref:Coiled-coil domain containing 191 n=1 Tax=Myripristis murdjan TaxID=586833 RepID=A0A667X142_9TELE